MKFLYAAAARNFAPTHSVDTVAVAMNTKSREAKRLFYDSQQHAAAALRVPIDDIRQAKREGCTAFRSGRVYCKEIRAWLRAKKKQRQKVAQGPSAVTGDLEKELRIEERKVRLERERFELQKAKDLMLPFAQYEYCLQRMCTALLATLNAFPGRVAPLLDGLDFYDRKRKLEEEIQVVKRVIRAADYLPKPDPSIH